MSRSSNKTFPSVLNLLPEMINFVCQSAKACGFNSKTMRQIELVAEEALVNIVSYAYPVDTKGDITITCNVDKNDIEIVISDKGIPFNPVQDKVPSPKDIPLHDRQVGGLGRYIIVKLMDEVNYERLGSSNVLKMRKSNCR